MKQNRLSQMLVQNECASAEHDMTNWHVAVLNGVIQ